MQPHETNNSRSDIQSKKDGWNKTELGNDIKMYNDTVAIPEHCYLITFIVFIIYQYGE